MGTDPLPPPMSESAHESDSDLRDNLLEDFFLEKELLKS